MNPKDMKGKRLPIRQFEKGGDGKPAKKARPQKVDVASRALDRKKDFPQSEVLVSSPEVLSQSLQQRETVSKVGAAVAANPPSGATDINRYLPQNTDERSSEVDRPFGYHYADHETVNLNNGSLRYEFVDFTIPGINGMDLEVKRVYNSTEATEREFTFEANRERAHFYNIYSIFTGEVVEVGGPYLRSDDLNDHRIWAIDEWGGKDVVDNYYLHMDSYFNYTTALRDNNQYLLEHKLGYGWRFGFPSIEAVPSGFNRLSGIGYRDYLHLGDGRRYAIKGNALEDYTLEDFTFASSSGSYSFPDGSTEAYRYLVTFKDGKKYYLNRTNIVAMEDRFGNKLCFRFDDSGIRIWDTLGRLTRLEKINVSSATTYGLRWTLPDGRTMQYSVRDGELYYAANFEGERTTYYYETASISAQLFYNYSGDTPKSTNMHLLKSILHPTGAATFYAWTGYREQVADRQIDDTGRMHDRKVLMYRYDSELIDDEYVQRNLFVYSYSVLSKAKRKTDRHREFQFDFYIHEARVSDAGRGTETVHTFDDKHLQTAEVTKLGARTLASKTFEYNSDELRIKETDVIQGTGGSRTVIQQWSFDKKANLLTQTDPFGFVTTMTYDTARFSLPTSKQHHVDPGKTRLVEERFALDSTGKTVSEVQVFENNALKQRTAMQYAANGNLTARREYDTAGALKRTTTYTYQSNIFMNRETVDGLPQTLTEFDLLGAVVKETDPIGNVTEYERDRQGRVEEQINPDGSSKWFFYYVNYDENTVYIIDEKDNESYVDYTPLGQVQQVADLTGPAILEGHYYDDCNRPLYDYTADANLYIKAWTMHEHDYADRPTCVQIADYQESTLMYQEDTVYDDAAQGQYVKASKTVRGDNVAAAMTSVEYADALGRVVRSGAVIGGAERLDVSTYDPQGNRLTFLSARDAARGMPYSGKWEYDFAGRVVREYAPRASAATPEVYALTEYDALGNTVRTVDFRGNATRYTHDALGRVIRQETDFEGSTPAVTEFTYDRNGNVTEQRVQANRPGEAVKWRRTTNTYDERGRVTDTVVYTGTGADDYDHTHYTYDERNNRTGVYTGVRNGALGGAQLTRYEYDHFDHVTRIIDPTGRSEYFFYDETGRLLNTQDKNHHAIVYGYDALDRVLQEVAFDLPTMTQELKVLKRYALTGALRYDQNPNQSFNYYYDETGHLAREVETNGATKTFTYDYSGARTGMALQRGAETILNLGYTYDHAGRLQTVQRDGVTIAEYAYDANGNRESLTYTGTGMVTSYAYNKANLVTSLVNRKGSDSSSQFTYTYFLDGNQATKAEPDKTTSYTYDLAGRLLQETAGAQTLAYTYDRFGNRATLTASGPEAYTTTYSYDSRNQLTRSSEVRGGVATVTDYGYDAVGNELFRARNGAVASTVDMEYNNYNQLVKVTKDGVATTYTYRPDGLRLSKTVAGVMTRHIWDGEQIIAELNSNGTTKSRFLRGVNLIAQQIDSQTQYYLFNAHGDVVQKTSSNGTTLKNYSYDAFGVESNMEALDQNPFRYCGEYFDKESETYYLRARYYNPRTGRFGAEDPAKDGLNWYTYCGSNPVLSIDPTGLTPWVQLAQERNPQSNFSIGYINKRAYGDVRGESLKSVESGWVNNNPPTGGMAASLAPYASALPALDGPLPIGDVLYALFLIWSMAESDTPLEKMTWTDVFKLFGAKEANWIDKNGKSRKSTGGIDDNATVKEILKFKQGGIKNAPRKFGGPSWNDPDFLETKWKDIVKQAESSRAYKEIAKLLGNNRFNK